MNKESGAGILVGLGLCVAVIIAAMFGCPKYKVYLKEMEGKGKLAESTHARQVIVEQARAEKDSAVLRAEAIQIVGEASKKYPEYRTQEFIGAFAEALKEGNVNQIIYVPTEANIPIIERRN